MTIQSALEQAIQKLTEHEITTAELDAQILLAHTLGQTKEYLLTYFSKSLEPQEEKDFFSYIDKRCDFTPIAYITGNKEFFGLDFIVTHDVLVPRPETELLVEQALHFSNTINKEPVVIADIGTGSGCIAISIAKQLPEARVVATDCSSKALTVAQKNSKKHDVIVEFTEGNFLEPLKNTHIDILVSNPPYGTKTMFQPNASIKHEPQEALYAGTQGLEAYHAIFHQLQQRDQLPSVIIGELDPRQSIEIKKVAHHYLPQYSIRIIKDLAQLDRVILLQKSNS